MKKYLAVLLAALTLVSAFSLSSCAKRETVPAASAGSGSAPAAKDYSKDTLDSKTLTVGVDDSYPPMEFKDDSGNITGFDVDMVNEIARRMGKTAVFKSTLFDGIFAALNADRFDCSISAISMTEERLKQFAFTKPYVANAQIIVVRPNDNSIKKAEDLANKTVGVQLGSTADDSAKTLLSKGIKFNVKKYNEIIQTFSDMKAGRLDAVIVDEVVGQYYIAKDKSSFRDSGCRLTNEPVGACFRKDNTKLRDDVQEIIDAMTADGTMKKISMKWFGKDLTSNIDANLKVLK